MNEPYLYDVDVDEADEDFDRDTDVPAWTYVASLVAVAAIGVIRKIGGRR